MATAIKITVVTDIVFILVSILSGAVGGALGEGLYYLSYIIPIAIGFHFSKALKSEREERNGLKEPPERLFRLELGSLALLVPLIAIIVAIVSAVSFLTEIALSAFGIAPAETEISGFIYMLLVYAAVPALFEEALFRYIPMKLLLPYSPRACVLYSALFFALIHCSFYQMTYAFVAGALFMLVNVALDSIWPSVILHFINNAVSLGLIKYCNTACAQWVFAGILLGCVLISIPFVFIRRTEYVNLCRGALKKGEIAESGTAPVALIIICCYIAVLNVLV